MEVTAGGCVHHNERWREDGVERSELRAAPRWQWWRACVHHGVRGPGVAFELGGAVCSVVLFEASSCTAPLSPPPLSISHSGHTRCPQQVANWICDPRCAAVMSAVDPLPSSSPDWLLYSARVLLAVSLLAAACVCGWWLVWRTVLRNIPLFQEVMGHSHSHNSAPPGSQPTSATLSGVSPSVSPSVSHSGSHSGSASRQRHIHTAARDTRLPRASPQG